MTMTDAAPWSTPSRHRDSGAWLVRQPNVESTDAAQLPAVGEEVALSWTHHMARIIVDRR